MEVYEFEKNLLVRLEEFLNVLSWEGNPKPASSIRSEWSYFIELQIEPTGWQALWKIPRVICEEMKIKYPTFVFGMIQHVMFKELKAIFQILAVQDDDIQLPEQQEVHLEDLWVTKEQENSQLNIKRTAECIDSLRFFYTNIWMPWDNENDDDLDWADKHLESRIRFYYDLKTCAMKRCLVAHIKTLLVEARYIQNRREYLELGLSDGEDDDEPVAVEKNKITDLMRLHLRLSMIRSEIEVLENPEMRKIYEDFKFSDGEKNCTSVKSELEESNPGVYVVAKICSLNEHAARLETAKKFVHSKKLVKICSSLQDALNLCNPSDTILLSPGEHRIKFLEHLNENGSIIGLASSKNLNQSFSISSCDDESILLVFDGNFTLKNLSLNCTNIRTGILVKNGNVYLENCQLIGNQEFSTRQGIILSGNSQLTLTKCSVEKFGTGLVLNNNSTLNLINSKIQSCIIGVEINDNAKIKFENSKILDSMKFGVFWETNLLGDNGQKEIFENFSVVKLKNLKSCPWIGNCAFENNCRGNVLIKNTKAIFMKLISTNLDEQNMLEDSEIEKISIRSSINDSMECDVSLISNDAE